jgi:putative Mg2+ transporter-C (MgtC) family protein
MTGLLAAVPSEATMVGRVAVAAGVGMVVGWEREIRNREAGARTFGLMTLGAALFAITGLFAPEETGRVIAGIATGVGFIGAGLVWREHQRAVHGLTTAAGVWAMVAVGVITGLGRFWVAIAVTAIVLVLLELPYLPLLKRLDPRRLQYRFRGDADLPDAPIKGRLHAEQPET